jgi:hypothetical protein
MQIEIEIEGLQNRRWRWRKGEGREEGKRWNENTWNITASSDRAVSHTYIQNI